jgi:cytochrome c-type biogenesis protein
MSGVSGEDLAQGRQRGRVLAATLLFVLGFAIIFTGLGVTASAVGAALVKHIVVLNRIAGAVVIVMGLIFLTTLAIKPLMRASDSSSPVAASLARGGLKVAAVFSMERSMTSTRAPRAGVAGAVPLGMAFAVSWTPCVGPGLGAILTLAATQGNVGKGTFLLFAFSLGFGVWFIAAGLLFRKAMGAFGFIRKHMGGMVLVGGVLMITIGVLMVTNEWNNVLAPIRQFLNHTLI